MHITSLKPLIVVLISLFILGCNSTRAPVRSTPELQAPPQKLEPIAAPKHYQPINTATLYDLLVADIALQRQQPGIATQHLLNQARLLHSSELAKEAHWYSQQLSAEVQLEAAQTWLQLNPTNHDAQLALTKALLRNHQPIEALQQASVIQDSANNALAYTLIGQDSRAWSTTQRRQIKQQLAQHLNHIQQPGPVQLKALLLWQEGATTEAVAYMEAYRSTRGAQPIEFILLYAGLLAETGQGQQAFALLQHTEARAPSLRVATQLAKLELNLNDGQSTQTLERIMAAYQPSAKWSKNMIGYCIDKHFFIAANMLIDQQPTLTEPLHTIIKARLATHLKEPTAAELWLSVNHWSAIVRYQDDISTALSDTNSKQLEHWFNELRDASDDSKSIEQINQFQLTFFSEQISKTATQTARAVLSVNPTHSLAHYTLAHNAMADNDTTTALQHLNQIPEELRSNTPQYIHLMAQALIADQHHSMDAVAAANQAVNLNPNSARYLATYSQALLFNGQTDAAISPIRAAISMDASAQYINHYLTILNELKHIESALQIRALARQQYPDYPFITIAETESIAK